MPNGSLKVGDGARIAHYHGLDAPFPKHEINQLRDLDGAIVKRITRNFVWLELWNGQKSRVPRKWVCNMIFGHISLPCPFCGYEPKRQRPPKFQKIRTMPNP
jgi:hypothetical protein